MKEYKKGIKSTAGVLLNNCLISEEETKRLKQQLADRDIKIEVLQRDVDNLHRTLEEANEELAEKDKEIEELKTQFDLYRSMSIQKDWNDTELIKSIRHQVCDEIREFIAKDLCGCSIEEWTHKIGWNEDLIKVFNKLDQIEKGE